MMPSEGERKYIEKLQAKSGEERLKSAFELSRLVKHVMEDGIRHQYPHISDEEFQNIVSSRLKRD
ncbi:MAG: hypothetical protein V1843_00350 [bacterium]